MIEIVNPSHPDKVADRIAGALVDYVYAHTDNPRIAVEVLIGHGKCSIIAEASRVIPPVDADLIVKRITGCPDIEVEIRQYPQDTHLASNQKNEIRCGDNGIFRGVPTNEEETVLGHIARAIYARFPSDGKYILDLQGGRLIICQSGMQDPDLQDLYAIVLPWMKQHGINTLIVNPLGAWTGGTDVDSGATNRKLGSDMGRAVTGGGLHGKDLSKADVSVNIFAHILAQKENREVSLCCAIGDTEIEGWNYHTITQMAKGYIMDKGGFEKMAEWGIL